MAEGKKTLLVVHAFSKLKGTSKENFLKIFTKKTKTLKDLEAIKKIFIQTQSLAYALSAINSRLAESQKILNNLKMHDTYRQLLGNALLKLFSHSKRIADLHQTAR